MPNNNWNDRLFLCTVHSIVSVSGRSPHQICDIFFDATYNMLPLTASDSQENYVMVFENFWDVTTLTAGHLSTINRCKNQICVHVCQIDSRVDQQ